MVGDITFHTIKSLNKENNQDIQKRVCLYICRIWTCKCWAVLCLNDLGTLCWRWCCTSHCLHLVAVCCKYPPCLCHRHHQDPQPSFPWEWASPGSVCLTPLSQCAEGTGQVSTSITLPVLKSEPVCALPIGRHFPVITQDPVGWFISLLFTLTNS